MTAYTMHIRPSDSAVPVFVGGRVVATALRKRAYTYGPAWTVYNPRGLWLGEASDTTELRRVVRGVVRALASEAWANVWGHA